MNNRLAKAAICTSMAVLLLGVSFSASGVTIRGTPSCGKWVEDRAQKGWGAINSQSWVLGFLSGVAAATEKEIIKGIDNPSIFLWIDNFCKANPLKDVADASHELVLEQWKKK
jgi:hypothetical protein